MLQDDTLPGHAVSGVPQQADHLIVPQAHTVRKHILTVLKNRIAAHVCAYVTVPDVPQGDHLVAAHFRVEIAGAVQKKVRNQRLFHLEGVQQVAGLIVQQPQTVVVLDLFGGVFCPVLPVELDGQSGNAGADKVNTRRHRRDFPRCFRADLQPSQQHGQMIVRTDHLGTVLRPEQSAQNSHVLSLPR